MDENLMQQWTKCIEGLGESEEVQKVLIDYVNGILQRNGVVILNLNHLAALTGLSGVLLAKMVNNPKSFYREFTIPKRSGGIRIISAPYPSLNNVQEWIYQVLLLPRTALSEYATGFVPGKSIVDNASCHVGHCALLKMDIKDFFPSITINRVISVFKNLGYYPRMAYYLAALCCENGHLPQGAPTSPMLSNIIAKRLDRRLSKLAECFDLTYTRYADDLTFSGDRIPIRFIEVVNKVVSSEGFMVNGSKTKRLGDGNRKIITGVSISSGEVCIPRDKKRRLRQEAYYIKKYGLKSHMRHCHINDPLFALQFAGKMAYWKSVEPNHPYVKAYFDDRQRKKK